VRTATVAIACGAICLSGLARLSAGQRVGLDVLPSLLEISQKPGARFEREVTLSNGGDDSLSVEARVQDWAMSENGEIHFAGPGTLPGSCGPWIAVEPQKIVVPPRGRAIVRVSVQSPPDARGSRWAVVFFELPEVPASAEGRSVHYAARVGLTVYVTAEGTEREELELLEASASADAVSHAVRLRAVFENRGNTSVRARLTWQIKSADGKFLRTYREPSVVTLPGSRREAVTRVDEEIPPGSYLVTAMARWGAKRWMAQDCQLVIPKKASLAV
jgi:fimbrial chaperone protein